MCQYCLLLIHLLHVYMGSTGWVKGQQGEGQGQHNADRTVQLQRVQSSYSMGLEWTGICTYAFKTTTSSKSFIINRMLNPHIFIHRAFYITLCIFPLQVKKNGNHKRAFILGDNSTAAKHLLLQKHICMFLITCQDFSKDASRSGLQYKYSQYNCLRSTFIFTHMPGKY